MRHIIDIIVESAVGLTEVLRSDIGGVSETCRRKV